MENEQTLRALQQLYNVTDQILLSAGSSAKDLPSWFGLLLDGVRINIKQQHEQISSGFITDSKPSAEDVALSEDVREDV